MTHFFKRRWPVLLALLAILAAAVGVAAVSTSKASASPIPVHAKRLPVIDGSFKVRVQWDVIGTTLPRVWQQAQLRHGPASNPSGLGIKMCVKQKHAVNECRRFGTGMLLTPIGQIGHHRKGHPGKFHPFKPGTPLNGLLDGDWVIHIFWSPKPSSQQLYCVWLNHAHPKTGHLIWNPCSSRALRDSKIGWFVVYQTGKGTIWLISVYATQAFDAPSFRFRMIRRPVNSEHPDAELFALPQLAGGELDDQRQEWFPHRFKTGL